MNDDRIRNLLIGLCGTGNMLLGCLMLWMSKPPESGGIHIVGIAGMLFVVTGLVQKAAAAGGWIDGAKKNRTDKQ